MGDIPAEGSTALMSYAGTCEVLRYSKIAPVPGAPDYVLGIV